MLNHKCYLISWSFFITLLILVWPLSAYAAECKDKGYTVVFVNGVFTSEDSAIKQKINLKNLLPTVIKGGIVNTELGHNESHLAGFGDLFKSVQQAYRGEGDVFVEDFDLQTILLQLHSQITTQKILLVGHSQGTFYTNALYKYFTEHGVPKEAVAVYNVATPASFVADGAGYLTSANDKVIERVREYAAAGGAKGPLAANILLPLNAQEIEDPYGGHAFSTVYLSGAPDRIISQMSEELGRLASTERNESIDGCFESPKLGIAYKAKSVAFAVADPLASGATTAGESVAKISSSALAFVEKGFAAAASNIVSAAGSLLPAANKDTTASAFGVAKALYGSSLEKSDVADLLGVPTRQSAPPQSQQKPAAVTADTEQASPAPTTKRPEPATEQLEPVIFPEEKSRADEKPVQTAETPASAGMGGGSSVAFVTEEEAVSESEVTTTVAAPSLSSSTCDGSIGVSDCVVATTTLSFAWSSDVNPAFYGISSNGSYATTTATSTNAVASDNSTYIFGVSAFDASGNRSATTTLSVHVSSVPVVINEIAWAGTSVSNTAQWIELHNTANGAVDLTGFVLHTSTLYIPLTGTISAGGYYLIEKDTDAVVNDVAADLLSTFPNTGGSFGIGGGGLTLSFRDSSATTTIDQQANCSFWCGGRTDDHVHGPYTMERYDAAVSGTNTSNWGTALGEFILTGHDGNGVTIKGTPKAKNSLSYLIALNGTLSANKTLASADSPYLVGRSGLTIASGVTLTLPGGVVIKMVSFDSPSITVNGTLKAEGSADEPVVITTFSDDTYGGDLNGDGGCGEGGSCPLPGSWRRLIFNSTSAGSELTHTIVRYGGTLSTSMPAMVAVDSATVSVANSIFEYSRNHGFYLTNSASTISDSTFRNNASSTDAAGLLISGGSPNVSDNTFTDNSYGIEISSAPNTHVFDNTFSDNLSGAGYLVWDPGSLEDNTGSGNVPNAFVLAGGVTTSASFGTTTLRTNTLPYILGKDLSVVSNSTLALEPGVIIKGYNSGSSNIGKITIKAGGSLYAAGTSSSDIVLTSAYDSVSGGQTLTSTTSPAAGDWIGINVESGGRLDMSGFTIRYAGGHTSGTNTTSRGAVFFASAATSTIRNALIDNTRQQGLRVTGSTRLSLGNTSISNHTAKISGSAAGISLESPATVVMDSVSFTNNEIDITGSGTITCSGATCGTPTSSPAGLLQ